MAFTHLFSPTVVGNVELKNRIVMAPMAPGLFRSEFFTERAKHFYLARANGGVGLIITGAMTILRQPNARPGFEIWDGGMYADKFIAGWRDLVNVIHQLGVKIGIQLTHVGRQVPADLYGAQPISSSAIPCPVCKSVPHELDVNEIEVMIARFANAARRGKEAGFDLVEIHAAHGYLGTQFLSPYMNKRTDEYGGDAQGRTKFVREIVQRIKSLPGRELTVGVRINGQDNIKGGATLEDAIEIAILLESAGADFFHVSATVYGGYPPIAPMAETPGCYVALAEGVRRAVKVPVIAVGKIDTPELAEDILETKKADLVALGRPLLTDPEWPNKAAIGKLETIRKCIYCNQGCLDRLKYMDLEGKLTPITCILNTEVGKEDELKLRPAQVGKRVLIVGGGPGGLEAARVAATRGHEVILFEKEEELGGQFLLASRPPTKQHYMDAIEYLARTVKALGVEIKLGCEGTPQSVMEIEPDMVIIATGASPSVPEIRGVKGEQVTTYDKILSGKFECGKRVLVVGGGSIGLETADFLGSMGRKVQVLEMTNCFGRDMGRVARFGLLRRLTSNKVTLLRDCKLTKIVEQGAEVVQDNHKKILRGFQSVVLAVGVLPNNSLGKQIKERIEEIYIIGDALKPRKASDAIHEGNMLGRRI